MYKYLEKRSLIEYYKTFYRNIKSGKIYNYIDLKKEYYGDNDYYAKINDMLVRFSKELEIYFENLKKEWLWLYGKSCQKIWILHKR